MNKITKFKEIKNILITGASGGIGSEIARAFSATPCRLFLVYNSGLERIKKLESELNSRVQVKTYKCDLSDYTQVGAMTKDILAEFKRIDVLVNCAGVSNFKQIQDITEKDFDHIFNNNLKSTVYLTKFVSKAMISNQSGRIINISSMWGKVGASMESLYSASKGAINAFTLSLAKELGPSGITVNAICPGLIDTDMNSELNGETIFDIVTSTPISRIGQPADVASLCVFLASNEASFITGQLINVDGGFSL